MERFFLGSAAQYVDESLVTSYYEAARQVEKRVDNTHRNGTEMSYILQALKLRT